MFILELGERGELTVGVRSRSRGRRLRCCHVYVLSMCVQAIDSHCGLRWRYAELGAALRRVKPGPLEVNELFMFISLHPLQIRGASLPPPILTIQCTTFLSSELKKWSAL